MQLCGHRRHAIRKGCPRAARRGERSAHGGTAAAVEAGSEAVNYRSEPNLMADRILTLHSVINCISQLPAMIDLEVSEDEDNSNVNNKNLPKDNENQTARHWRRTAMNGLKPLTAGALSAVSIVTEAREMKNTGMLPNIAGNERMNE